MEHKDYPSLYQASDLVSNSKQSLYLLLMRVDFALLIGASIWVALPGTNPKTTALVGAGFLVASIGLKLVLRSLHLEKHWFSCRAVAESVKTLTWRYAMGVKPFILETDPAPADNRFVEELKSIRKQHQGIEKLLTAYFTPDAYITLQVRSIRALPLQERASLYLDKRLRDQKLWYSLKSKASDKADGWWFCTIIGLQLLAIGAALLRLYFDGDSIIQPGPMITLSAILVTWTQLKRFQGLSQSYAVAAHELTEHESMTGTINTQADLEANVLAVEEMISREHTMWSAKHTHP